LSALIDEGRFFFENKRHPTFGAEKPPAYQGFRPKLLDYLVAVHDWLKGYSQPLDSVNGAACSEIWMSKREFVSELQRIIEPKWLSKQASYKEYEAT